MATQHVSCPFPATVVDLVKYLISRFSPAENRVFFLWLFPPRPGAINLTDSERELLAFIANGMTEQAIAKHHAIDIKTVQLHKKLLRKRLDVKTTAEMIRYAVEFQLVPPLFEAPPPPPRMDDVGFIGPFSEPCLKAIQDFMRRRALDGKSTLRAG